MKLGFSALETVIVISLFSVAMLIVMSLVVQTYQANRFADEQNEAINHARNGIDTMVKELREASPGDNGDYPVYNAQPQSFSFYGDIDLDGAVERVRYYLSGSDLMKGIIEPTGFPPTYNPGNEVTHILSRYVRNNTDPIFYYYNGNWPDDVVNNPLSSPIDTDSVKLLHMYLKINFNPAIAPDDFVLESNVQVRNLKTNL